MSLHLILKETLRATLWEQGLFYDCPPFPTSFFLEFQTKFVCLFHTDSWVACAGASYSVYRPTLPLGTSPDSLLHDLQFQKWGHHSQCVGSAACQSLPSLGYPVLSSAVVGLDSVIPPSQSCSLLSVQAICTGKVMTPFVTGSHLGHRENWPGSCLPRTPFFHLRLTAHTSCSPGLSYDAIVPVWPPCALDQHVFL